MYEYRHRQGYRLLLAQFPAKTAGKSGNGLAEPVEVVYVFGKRARAAHLFLGRLNDVHGYAWLAVEFAPGSLAYDIKQAFDIGFRPVSQV